MMFTWRDHMASLTEQIKAKAFSTAFDDDICTKAVFLDDVLKLLADEEAKREPLMAHLQPENRPGGYEYASTQNDILELWDEALKWFEELDKLVRGKSKC